jgi:DivIVA domain-containing protein
MTARTEGRKFRRAGRFDLGYDVSEVDALVKLIEATLAGGAVPGQTVTATDVRQSRFTSIWRGYDPETVDKALDMYALQLDSAAQRTN